MPPKSTVSHLFQVSGCQVVPPYQRVSVEDDGGDEDDNDHYDDDDGVDLVRSSGRRSTEKVTLGDGKSHLN